MEKLERNCNIRALMISELTQGVECAKQLHVDTNLDPETQKLLVQKIYSSYSKVLSMINNTAAATTPDDHTSPVAEYNNPKMKPIHLQQLFLQHGRTLSFQLNENDESAAAGCSRRRITTPNDEQAVADGPCSKKRKMLPKRSTEVRVCSPESSEGSGGVNAAGALNDGYSWRKYGQKDILGAIYPRNYYRCTHRHTLGCLATKQIQKSDNDPTLIRVSYCGTHTCRLNTATSTTTCTDDQPASTVQQSPKPDQLSDHHPQQIMPQLHNIKTEDNSSSIPEEGSRFIFQSFSSLTMPAPPTLKQNDADWDNDLTNYELIFSTPHTAMKDFSFSNPFADSSAGFLNVSSGGCSVGTPESSDALSVNGSSTIEEGFDFSLEELGIDPAGMNFDNPEFFSPLR